MRAPEARLMAADNPKPTEDLERAEVLIMYSGSDARHPDPKGRTQSLVRRAVNTEGGQGPQSSKSEGSG